jgi:hypothetical protein
VVAWRPAFQRWVVELPDLSRELAPVFDNWTTAAEIAGKFQDGHAFCADIPCVDIGTVYPRPNRMQPARTIDLTRFYPSDKEGLDRLAQEMEP